VSSEVALVRSGEPNAPATPDRDDLAEKASELLLRMIERMGISADIDIKDDTDKTVLEIQAKDTELVISPNEATRTLPRRCEPPTHRASLPRSERH
jgi:predicted RNA-binding protein Jag